MANLILFQDDMKFEQVIPNKQTRLHILDILFKCIVDTFRISFLQCSPNLKILSRGTNKLDPFLVYFGFLLKDEKS